MKSTGNPRWPTTLVGIGWAGLGACIALQGALAADPPPTEPPTKLAAAGVYVAAKRELTVFREGSARFRYIFNRGGAISGVFDLSVAPGKNLIGESFQGETTDRVIQWTYWNARYEGAPHDLGDGDVRVNATMEGSFNDQALCEVVSTPKSGPLAIGEELRFDSRIEHWFYAVLDRHGTPRFDTRSRYRILEDGSLALTRSVRRYPWRLKQVNVVRWDASGETVREAADRVELVSTIDPGSRVSSYFEGWTPLNRTLLPRQSHGKGSFEADGYHFWDPETLGGWSMAHSDTQAFAVVFGLRQAPANALNTRLVFNKLDLPQHRLNILMPAVVTDWPNHHVLTQSLVFVVGEPDEVISRASELAPKVPWPSVTQGEKP